MWFVDFAPLSDPSLVPQRLAATLDVREQPAQPLLQTLINYLRDKPTLLLLDNCEHLIEACAQLTETLLQSCAHLRILATSREALRIDGETIFLVPSLASPDPSQLSSLETFTQFEAVRLFIERASEAQPTFTVTDANLAAVAQICHRLDGIPLAIELAAARVRALSAKQIAARLDDVFHLLTSGSRTLPRHQTLRAAIDWSYELLSDDERTLFRRLSVFAGGWTLEAAEAVCSDDVGASLRLAPTDILDVLSQLVNKSLVLAEERDGETRYRLLEPIQQYAREKLQAAGESERIQDRHLGFFLKLAEEVEPKLNGAGVVIWLNRLEIEHNNLRAAIEWALETGETIAALRLTGALWFFWHSRSYHSEGRKQLRKALSQPEAAKRTPQSALARARALNGFAWLEWVQANYTDARLLLEEALAIGREWGDKWTIARSLLFFGLVFMSQSDYSVARSFFEQRLVIQRELANTNDIGWSLSFLGEVAQYQGDYLRAQKLQEEAAGLLREVSDTGKLAAVIRRLGQIALHLGDYEKAATLCKESLTINLEWGQKAAVAACLAGLAAVAAARGQKTHAVQLFGAVEALLESIQTHLLPVDLMEYEHNVVAVHAQLSEATFKAAWETGRRMTMEAALAKAQQVTVSEQPIVSTPSEPTYPAGLTAREG